MNLSLDEAIRIALANAKVVRVLAGTTATSSAQTIYDPAISNTGIDTARSVFDPIFNVNNNWSSTDKGEAVLNPADPNGVTIMGTTTRSYDLQTGLTKKNVLGGTLGLTYQKNLSRFRPGQFVLNPQGTSVFNLSYTQPLFKGAGVSANLAPIVIARIDTERSYFQFKDSVQELVRGVIEAYWNVVSARTDVWSKQQQVEQGNFAYQLADARRRNELGTAAAVAQAKVALSNFKANLVGSEGNLLTREAALRNILGLAPNDPARLIPVTQPTELRVEPKWDEIVRLGQQRRPELIELNLIIEADQQSLVVANNQAMPQLDAATSYQWNGLEGKTPSGTSISTGAGELANWSMGVNFSVPLGLRQGRAGLRRAELILARDRANLEQGLHAMAHDLAAVVRTIDQNYEQYRAFKETREAARENLEQQLAEFRAGRTIYLNVLQAISDWGNSITAEALSLTRYNTDLANLRRSTGTILETHAIWFFEERFAAIGPLGRLGPQRLYPLGLPPGPNDNRYPTGTEPAEKVFRLDPPAIPKGQELGLIPTVLRSPRATILALQPTLDGVSTFQRN